MIINLLLSYSLSCGQVVKLKKWS